MAGKNATRQTPGVREQWAVRALFFVGGFVGAGLFGLWVGTMLGYLGVLMGPAAIGFLAHAIGIADAFLFLALLVAVEMGIAAYVFRSVKA